VVGTRGWTAPEAIGGSLMLAFRSRWCPCCRCKKPGPRYAATFVLDREVPLLHVGMTDCAATASSAGLVGSVPTPGNGVSSKVRRRLAVGSKAPARGKGDW